VLLSAKRVLVVCFQLYHGENKTMVMSALF